MIKNIIFDWSGVINDDADVIYKVTQRIFKKFGAKTISFEEFKNEWVQPFMLFYNKYLPDLTLEEESKAYKKLILKYNKPKTLPGFAELLKQFKSRGIRMFVVSSDFYETVESDLKLFGMEGIFERVYAEVIDKKNVVEEVVSGFRLNPKQTLIVGDSNHEIEAGKKVGIKTAGVIWGFLTRERIKALKPNFIFENLEEFREAVLARRG